VRSFTAGQRTPAAAHENHEAGFIVRPLNPAADRPTMATAPAAALNPEPQGGSLVVCERSQAINGRFGMEVKLYIAHR
jgi:hypothetical protein